MLDTQLNVRRRRTPAHLRRRASTLDALLTDTAQDLGLVIDLTDRSQVAKGRVDEDNLVELARKTRKLTILPVLRIGPRERQDQVVELRVIAARPGSRTLLTRVERVAPEDLSVRAVVMLRDLVREGQAEPAPQQKPVAYPPTELAEPAFSAGRAILAVNGTVYGGFLGYSLQRASGSDDPRLLYPLVGVGAGVGLGAAIIVADEWNVGVGDAWYLAAGALWPAVGAHLIHEGRFADRATMPEGEQWALGLVASTTGLGLSAVGLLHRGMGDGGAALAHTGGGVGTVIGGLAELATTGSDENVPLAGMGYGAMAGWLVGSATAIHIHPPADRVLTISVGTALGGLAGASAASPLLFDEASPGEVRGWVGAAGGGLIAGAGIAWYLSEDDPEQADDADESEPRGHPRDVVYQWGLVQPALITMPASRPLSHEEGRQADPTPLEARLPPAAGVRWQAVLW